LNALLLVLALLGTETVPGKVDASIPPPALVSTVQVLAGELEVRRANSCAGLETPPQALPLPAAGGPLRFERRMWLNLREEVRPGTVRVEREGNHLRAIVDYLVHEPVKGQPVPSCLYQAELVLTVENLPAGNYELDFVKASAKKSP